MPSPYSLSASFCVGAAATQPEVHARIRQFEFGQKDVDQMVVTWPVDFLPS